MDGRFCITSFLRKSVEMALRASFDMLDQTTSSRRRPIWGVGRRRKTRGMIHPSRGTVPIPDSTSL
ncbi:hypothetical protein M407DRAFT_179530 [Tulasnella calospora MUT 4182]|uniref:Uncharacterized protein n=1 Tax=Tulasnella calospora MUT 4182 TaxID=1051891 RepID=A0A0C3Q356_9AGAM|nr:hypothetical protein M407DRAFT_179530 [Tulasnella calospora MUT 4182]